MPPVMNRRPDISDIQNGKCGTLFARTNQRRIWLGTSRRHNQDASKENG